MGGADREHAAEVGAGVPPSDLDTRAADRPQDSAPANRRYWVDEAGGARVIVSVSAPNVHLRVEPGMAVGTRALTRFPAQTIFLDGAFDGPPFHDNQKRLYSLDHHAGCVRGVTLATCEQAAVVLMAGLPINEGTWTLYINEPDLDSILAAWVLMNHIDLLRDDRALLAAAMPLLRVEGNIDTWGFGKEVLTALPPGLLGEHRAHVDTLMRPLLELKRSGGRGQADFEQVVLLELDEIDRLVLPGELVAQLLEYQELGRRRLRGRRIAILCRSAHGIYEVEEHLRQRYGKLLGIVVLDQGNGRFTVRRSDSFLELPLRPLYEALNRVDRHAASYDGYENRWGGADDIGGSPRATGSALSGREILDAIERLLGERPSLLRRLTDIFR